MSQQYFARNRAGLCATVAAIAAGVVALGATSEATAHNFGLCNVALQSGCKPEDNAQGACWLPNPTTSTIPFAAWQHVIGYMFNGTFQADADFVMSWHNTCPSGRDMRLTDELMSTANLGLTTPTGCSGSGSGAVCQGAVVAVNAIGIFGVTQSGLTDPFGNALMCPGVTNREALAQMNWCHETGHSMGMGHNTNASNCMNTGCSTATNYKANDLQHLRDEF